MNVAEAQIKYGLAIIMAEGFWKVHTFWIS